MMARHKYIDGEMIALSWDGEPDALYFQGHICNCLALLTAHREEADGSWCGTIHNGNYENHEYKYKFELVSHGYARWEFCGVDECGDARRILSYYAAPGRGKFKVTALWIVGKEYENERRFEFVMDAIKEDRKRFLALQAFNKVRNNMMMRWMGFDGYRRMIRSRR